MESVTNAPGVHLEGEMSVCEAGFGKDGWDSGGTRGNEGADGVGNGVSRKYSGFYPWCCRCADSLLHLKLGCL